MIDLEPAPTAAVPPTEAPPAPADVAPHASRGRCSMARAAAPATGRLPMTGTLPDGTQVTGQITDLTTRVVDGVLTAVGTMTVPGHGTDAFTALVLAVEPDSSSTVLTLDLSPLYLELRGLSIDLAPLRLDVNAVPGSGNLLGNLVRAVFLLLDDTSGEGASHRLSALLNQLLFGLGL